jgi:hypothetical protein
VGALDTDLEHFCEVEQNSYPAREFGMDSKGLMIHIKRNPVGHTPGSGHTLQGWDVWFEGTPSVSGDLWQLTKIWEQR